MKRLVVTLVALGASMAIYTSEASAQGYVDCTGCNDWWAGSWWVHNMPPFAQEFVDPNTGHGPHGGYLFGSCTGSHTSCDWGQEEEDAVDVLSEAGADLGQLLGSLTVLGSRAVFAQESTSVQVVDCAGSLVADVPIDGATWRAVTGGSTRN